MGRSRGSFNLDTPPPATLPASLQPGLSRLPHPLPPSLLFFLFHSAPVCVTSTVHRFFARTGRAGCKTCHLEPSSKNCKTGSTEGRRVAQILASICLWWCDLTRRPLEARRRWGSGQGKRSQAEARCSKALGQPVMSWGCKEAGAMLFQGAD